ncbi:MAG: hypothetical protein JO297_21445 [Nitrososphaeraceae archaeon]|nr:hypothetical protein [Nitrososphaeraceae archaeon]
MVSVAAYPKSSRDNALLPIMMENKKNKNELVSRFSQYSNQKGSTEKGTCKTPS